MHSATARSALNASTEFAESIRPGFSFSTSLSNALTQSSAEHSMAFANK
jgi:hypothetical protein